MAKRRTEYLDETSWVDEAFEVLSDKGVDDVGIESLAKRLGVTKGSFYWHFKDRAALLTAVLRRWQQRATLSIIERLEHSGMSTAERLRKLVVEPQSTPQSRKGGFVELAIRAWARKDPVAAAAVKEVDQQRLTYLQSLCRALGSSEEEALARAYLLYAAQFAECLITADESSAERTKRLARLTKTIMGTDAIFAKADNTASGRRKQAGSLPLEFTAS
jgi:AcrR family transcriptional regulator